MFLVAEEWRRWCFLRRRHLLCTVFCWLGFSGCKKPEMTYYEVPKETTPPQEMALPPGHPPTAPAASAAASEMARQSLPTSAQAASDNPAWMVPQHWQPGTVSAMRRGSFRVTQDGESVDISITVFPGDVGGLVANVNRWRGQIGLPALAPEEIAPLVASLPWSGGVGQLVDIRSETTRTLSAILPYGGNSWFIKMTGPIALVEAEKPAFLEFIGSIRF